MALTRRDLVRRLGIGAAAAAAPLADVRLRAASLIGGREAAGPPSRPIALDQNGNAYGLSARALEAVTDSLLDSSRSTTSDTDLLTDAVAYSHRIARDRVVVARGADEILLMTLRAFAEPRTSVVTASPTYAAVGRSAGRLGTAVVAMPLAGDWSHDLPAMLRSCDGAARLVYICNPNNPTGSLTRRNDIERFIDRLPPRVHVLVDEAYHHYVDASSEYRSFIDHPIDDARVIVVRSFSKIYGLSGLRVGYAVAAPQTAAALAAQAPDDGVGALAARAAIAALEDGEHVARSRRRNADDRQEFLNQANARMLRCIDSQTNFVMMGTEHPVGAATIQLRVDDIVDHFAKNHIVLPRAFAPLNDYVRVSLGTAAEMREFWRAWEMMGIRHM